MLQFAFRSFSGDFKGKYYPLAALTSEDDEMLSHLLQVKSRVTRV